MCVSRTSKCNGNNFFSRNRKAHFAISFRSTQLKWFVNINRSGMHEFNVNCTENRIKSQPNQNSTTFKMDGLINMFRILTLCGCAKAFNIDRNIIAAL